MTDANANGIITQEVVLYDKDGGAIDSNNALPVNVLSMPPATVGLTDDELRASPVQITQPNISVASAISGQITVTTAGTEVQGGNVVLTNGVYIRALSGNTGVVYVGNDGNGAVTSSNGYQLDKGEAVPLQVSNLNQLWFDAATNGDKFCWIKA